MTESERVRVAICKQSAKTVRGILWEGESPLTGAPIVAIATPTVNRKTGPMVQVCPLANRVLRPGLRCCNASGGGS